MLDRAPFVTMIPVTDLERARTFYEETLGLHLLEATPFTLTLEAGEHARLRLYRRDAAGGDRTLIEFQVPDLGATMAELAGAGVRFEEYDTPALRTTAGIAELGPSRVAWFRDPDGNLLSLHESGSRRNLDVG